MVSTVKGARKAENGLNNSLVSLAAMRRQQLRYNRTVSIATLTESPSRGKRAATQVRKSLRRDW